MLRDHGFGPAVRALADQARGLARDRVRRRHRRRGRASATTASIALYTILRELVDQAVRRGPPTTDRDRASRRRGDGGLVASVADDADPERRMRSLEAIEERARQLHGTLEVEPADGGTDDPRHAARPHGTAGSHRAMAEENGSSARSYLLFAWSPDRLRAPRARRRAAGGRRGARGRRPQLEVVKIGASPLPGDSRRCVYTVGTH